MTPRILSACLVLLVAALPARAQHQAKTDWFEITRSEGVVKQIKIHLVRQNQVVILDRFTPIAAFVKNEKENFSTPVEQDAVCKKFPQPQSCEQSCYWASKARPFGRVRLQTQSGQIKWQWQAQKNEAWPTLLSSSTNPLHEGSCLSPDGQYVVTAGYFLRQAANPSPQNSLAGYSVVKIQSQFKAAEVVGQKTQEPFGHERFTRFEAWQTQKPHTLIFEVNRPDTGSDVSVMDKGVPH